MITKSLARIDERNSEASVSKQDRIVAELRRLAAAAAPGAHVASVASLMAAVDCGLATAVRGAARARELGIVDVVHGPNGGYIAPRPAPQPSAAAARLYELAGRAQQMQAELAELAAELGALAAAAAGPDPVAGAR
jgi:hypothetical protein